MIKAFDHVAIPIEAVEEMLEFYRKLGFKIKEEYKGFSCSVNFGDNKINFHLPNAWKEKQFTLRGPKAYPGCGDFCFVWEGTLQSLIDLLKSLNAKIEEGPVERVGGRNAGTEKGTSIYTRDPDSNLLEFIVYP